MPPALGNPILAADGRKVQIETDGDFDGWPLQRFYSSIGSAHHYATVAEPTSFGATWRDGFDIKVESVAGSAFAAAALSTPDGALQYFRADGTAILSTSSIGYLLTSVSGGYLLRTNDELLQFDLAGHLTAKTKATGFGLTFSYSDGTTGSGGQIAVDYNGQSLSAPVPAGLLITVTSSSGRKLTYQRDTSGRITQMIIASSQSTIRFVYLTNGPLAQVIFPDGHSAFYAYNEPAYMSGGSIASALTGISHTNAAGGVSRYAAFSYEATGRAFSTEHAGGAERHVLSYPTQFQQTVDVDPLGASRTYSFQSVNGVLKPSGVSQPGGSGCAAASSNVAYDAIGNLASTDDFDGNRTCYSIDSVRSLEATRVEGLANTTACSAVVGSGAGLPSGSRKISTLWHPDWRTQSKRAEPRKLTTFVYNGQPDPFNGGAAASCAPVAALLPNGKPIRVLCKQVEQATTDVDGGAAFGAALDATVPARTYSYTYDSAGRVLTSSDPLGRPTTNAYYADTTADHTLGDLRTTTNALGQVTTFDKYNPYGQATQITAANGVVTSNLYNLQLRLASSTIGADTTAYLYDPSGQVSQITLPDGTVTRYAYDDAHRLVSITDAAGNKVNYTLDGNGNRVSEQIKDASGTLLRSINRSIDALNRVQSVTGAPS